MNVGNGLWLSAGHSVFKTTLKRGQYKLWRCLVRSSQPKATTIRLYQVTPRANHRKLSTTIDATARRRPRPPYLLLGTITVLFGNTAALTLSPDYRYKAHLFVVGVTRSVNTVFTAGVCVVDYKILHLRWAADGYDSDTYKDERAVISQRCARRLLRVCKQNKGLYIKVSQWFSTVGAGGGRNNVMKAYVDVLGVMQDQAPQRSYKEVERTFRAEFDGLGPHDLFDDFKAAPIAAASLAQVHEATYKGEKVAVKVQHDDVTRLFATDIATMRFMSRVVTLLFGDIDLEWYVNEFEKTLITEFDFENEARNAEDTAQRFAYLGDSFCVPKVYHEVTKPRVLTMEFVQGVKVTDVEGLKAMKIRPGWVYEQVMNVFAEMIFVNGEVHADPHPGNMLIIRSPSGSPSVCLIDHGLYRELDTNFRQSYCLLWRSLLLNDTKGLNLAAERLGCPPRFIELLPVIFTGRQAGAGATPLGSKMTSEDRAKLKESVGDIDVRDVVAFLEALPRDMLLVARTNNLIRGIRKALGGSPTLVFKTNAKYAIRGWWSETKEEEAARIAITHEKIGPPKRWYLYGGAPTLSRSLRSLNDAIWTSVRIFMGESFLSLYMTWRWIRYGQRIEWN